MLESSIAFVEKKANNVTLEDDFFVEADIRVVKKNRNRPRKRFLISEQDTSQENTTDETTTFHFRTSFEETTSVSLAATQGLTASLGGALGVGGMGGNIGLSSGLQYSRSKSIGQDKSNTATKELTADVEVKPNTLVIVKELVYKVEWAAMCELKLILRKKDKIKYTCNYGSRKKIRFIEVNKLLQKAIQQRECDLGGQVQSPRQRERSPCYTHSIPTFTSGDQLTTFTIDPYHGRVKPLALYYDHVMLTENMIVITFSTDCLFKGEEHKLEIIKLPSDPDRVRRIIDHQTGLSNQSNEEDKMLSLTGTKCTRVNSTKYF